MNLFLLKFDNRVSLGLRIQHVTVYKLSLESVLSKYSVWSRPVVRLFSSGISLIFLYVSLIFRYTNTGGKKDGRHHENETLL